MLVIIDYITLIISMFDKLNTQNGRPFCGNMYRPQLVLRFDPEILHAKLWRVLHNRKQNDRVAVLKVVSSILNKLTYIK